MKEYLWMTTNLVTVAAVMNSAQAQFVVDRLAEAEIEATIVDDNVVSMDFLFGNAVGWIKVQVREQDVDRAEDILAAAPSPVSEDEIPWDQPPEEEPVDEDASEEEIARKVEGRAAPVDIDPALATSEEVALRVYRLAIIGLVLFPPLLNIYSLVLMYRADPEETKKLSEASVRRSSLAFLINIFSILTFMWIWIGFGTWLF